MYERHKKFVGWINEGNSTTRTQDYLEYIKMTGYKDIEDLRAIMVRLNQLSAYIHIYDYQAFYFGELCEKIRLLYLKIGNLTRDIEQKVNGTSVTRSSWVQSREEYYDEPWYTKV